MHRVKRQKTALNHKRRTAEDRFGLHAAAVSTEDDLLSVKPEFMETRSTVAKNGVTVEGLSGHDDWKVKNECAKALLKFEFH